jgi:hypothetical protein
MAEHLSNEHFETLRARLRRHGHVKFPLLGNEIDDLTAQAIADLWRFLDEREGAALPDDESILRIAYAIFNRRAADLYRKTAFQLGARMDLEVVDEQPDEARGDASMHLLYRRMLAVCSAELSRLPQEDQLSVAIATGMEPAGALALTPAERQRLHRVRKRLATAIQRELGEDAYRLLRDV